MPTFIVKVPEIHIQDVEVEAESPEDAKDKVAAGEGKYLDNSLEYSHTLDSERWTVEEAD